MRNLHPDNFPFSVTYRGTKTIGLKLKSIFSHHGEEIHLNWGYWSLVVTLRSKNCKQNPSRPRCELFDCTSIFHGKTLCLYVLKFWGGFKLQYYWINSQDPAAPQSNSSCLEINHFRDTTTACRAYLKQHFFQRGFPWNPVVSLELERIV